MMRIFAYLAPAVALWGTWAAVHFGTSFAALDYLTFAIANFFTGVFAILALIDWYQKQ